MISELFVLVIIYISLESVNTCQQHYQNVHVDQSSSNLPSCPTCVNGFCNGYGSCNCYDGYHRVSAIECQPSCLSGCTNSKCIAPNTCSCDPGYTKDSKLSNRCDPVCSPICINADCVSPNACKCKVGYNNRGGNVCLSECPSGCPNGTCIGSNTCKCNEGYINVNNGHNACIPYCPSGCFNGTCIAPNICRCRVGYVEHIAASCGTNLHTPAFSNEGTNARALQDNGGSRENDSAPWLVPVVVAVAVFISLTVMVLLVVRCYRRRQLHEPPKPFSIPSLTFSDENI